MTDSSWWVDITIYVLYVTCKGFFFCFYQIVIETVAVSLATRCVIKISLFLYSIFLCLSDNLEMGYQVVFSFLSLPFWLHLYLSTLYFKHKERRSPHIQVCSWIKQKSFFPVNNFFMLPFRPQKIIWHGSTANGIRLVSNYCEAWHTADMGAMGQASPLNTEKLLDQRVYSCNNLFIVLCIENSFVSDPQGK